MAAFESRLITGYRQLGPAHPLQPGVSRATTHVALDGAQMAVYLRDKALQVPIELLARHAAEHGMHACKQVIHIRVLRWRAQQAADCVQRGVLRVLGKLGRHVQQVHRESRLLCRSPVFELGQVSQALEDKGQG